MTKRILFILLWLPGVVFLSHAQRTYNVYAAAFYNLENLFDTEDDPDNTGDDEFLPGGPYKWTPERYAKKLDNMARVIGRLARENCPSGPAVIGVAEVENRRVLEDLVRRPAVADMGLEIVHFESPDWRGIDVGFLYNPKLFKVTGAAPIPYVYDKNPDYRTRDILLVSGILAGEPLHVLVNHWPSRYGGKSSELREVAARIAKAAVDSLYRLDPQAKVIVMGDLNDDPVDKSCRVVLDAKKTQAEVQEGGLYNTMWKFYDLGIGSLGYQGKWNLFDQIIVSYPLLGKDYSSLKYWKAEIFNRDFLIEQEGNRKGYPHRTFSNNTFLNGYSDHFPTLIYMIKARHEY